MIHTDTSRNPKVGRSLDLSGYTAEDVSFSTYNSVRGLTQAQETFLREHVTLRERSFIQPKGRRKMTIVDPNVRAICEERHKFRFNLLFMGKVPSGSLDNAKGIAELCEGSLEDFWLLLCPHELEEKRTYFIALGFLESQFIEFTDEYFERDEQCNEFLALLKLFAHKDVHFV